MNVLEYVQNELKGKHLTDLEKLRYIYLVDCQLFSFDARWYYFSLWQDFNLCEELIKKEIDLTNVNDFRVICISNSKSVLKSLVDEFTSINSYVVYSGGHYFLRTTGDFGTIDLDPTNSDFATSKIGLRPKSFLLNDSSLNDNDRFNFQKELDDSLGKSFKTKLEVIGKHQRRTASENLKVVADLINEHNLKYYSDAATLFRKYADNEKINYATYASKDYDFHKLALYYPDNSLYELSKIDECYKVNIIDRARIRDIKTNPTFKTRF